MTATETTFDFDPFDPAYWDDPYPSYEVMRAEHPVFCRATPFGRMWPHYWMLSRASMRARWIPMHRWGPQPKDTCSGSPSRSMRKSSEAA